MFMGVDSLTTKTGKFSSSELGARRIGASWNSVRPGVGAAPLFWVDVRDSRDSCGDVLGSPLE